MALIKPTDIPDEVVEAAAIAAMKDGGCGLTVDGRHVLCCDQSVRDKVGAYGESLYQEREGCSCYTMSRAAIVTAINAWTNTYTSRWVDGTPVFILPLPQKEGDA